MKQPTKTEYLYDDLSNLIWQTRNHPGLSIKDIAKIFGENFDEAEIKALIEDLKEELKLKVGKTN
jgi:chromosome segregation and condensation protein ScpB